MTVPRGRAAEAARNDEAILDAARAVFVEDPAAPVSAVAKRAGVGIGALYHRYASKEELLGTVAARGQEIYLTEVEAALAAADPWTGYTTFLRNVVDADTHALTVRLAGTFTPDADHLTRAERMRTLTDAVVERVRTTGLLRDDVAWLDVSLLLEALSQVRLGDTSRSAEIRRRQLTLVVDGLRAHPDATPLPGDPPRWEEQEARWTRA